MLLMHRFDNAFLAKIRRTFDAVFRATFGAGVQDQLWAWLSRQPLDGSKLPRAGRPRRM
jgi:hypothetical protein